MTSCYAGVEADDVTQRGYKALRDNSMTSPRGGAARASSLFVACLGARRGRRRGHAAQHAPPPQQAAQASRPIILHVSEPAELFESFDESKRRVRSVPAGQASLVSFYAAFVRAVITTSLRRADLRGFPCDGCFPVHSAADTGATGARSAVGFIVLRTFTCLRVTSTPGASQDCPTADRRVLQARRSSDPDGELRPKVFRKPVSRESPDI